MRKSFGPIGAVLALTFISACGASGGQTEAGVTTSTTAAASQDSTTTTAASSGDTVSIATWAAGFCGSFDAWISKIKEASSTVGSGLSGGDVAAGKAAIIRLFETASAETKTLISSLEDGGVPDMSDGDRFVSDLTGKFQDFDRAIDAAKTEAEALPIDDPAGFSTKVAVLVKTFTTETTAVGNSFTELDGKYPSPVLSSALTDSCDSI